MYEKQCAMHTLYDCFVNECDKKRIIYAVTILASAESNFNTYTGCQLKTNKKYHWII